jgi:hypothetical protein
MNPIEEFDDTTRGLESFGVKPVCYENVSITITYIQGSYLYRVVAWLLVDYEHNIWYLIYRPSANAYPSIRPFHSGHVTTQSREISANSPFAERKQIADRKLLCRIFWRNLPPPDEIFFTKLGPQIRLSPVPNFGVNICPFNYGIKVILFWNWLNCQRLQVKSVQHLFSLLAIHRSLRPDPNPRSSFPKARIFNGGSKSSCSGKIHPRKFHLALPFSIFTSDFSLRLFLIGAFHRSFDS